MNAREGSIIEYEYAENWDSYSVRDWYFQSDYPTLKSVYTTKVPVGFNYAITFQNKKYLALRRMDSLVETFFPYNIKYEDLTVHIITWVCENIPPMRSDAFTSTVDNFISCLKFQISARPGEPGTSVLVLNNWEWLSNRLLESPDFGIPLKAPVGALKKQAKAIAEGNQMIYKSRGGFLNTFVQI